MGYSLNSAKGLLSVGKTSIVEQFTTKEALTAGDWVDLDASQADEARAGTVVQGNGSGLCIGVVLETAAVDDVVHVCTDGYVAGAKTDGTVAAGEILIPAAGGASTPKVNTTVLGAIGIALEADRVAPNDATHVDCIVRR